MLRKLMLVSCVIMGGSVFGADDFYSHQQYRSERNQQEQPRWKKRLKKTGEITARTGATLVAVPAGALLGGAAGTALFLWGLWPIKGFIVINVTVAPLAPIILAGKGAYEGGKLCWK